MIKKGIQQVNEQKYQELYGNNTLKNFTFAAYFGKAKFKAPSIYLEQQQIILNISTNESELSLYLYNGLMSLKGEKVSWGSVDVTVENVAVVPQNNVTEQKVLVRTLSPIVCRDHCKETNKDWFLTIEDKEFANILKRNLETKLVPILGEYIKYDIEDLEIRPAYAKKTVVQFYERKVACSLGKFYIEGKPHLLNYLLQSGVGSLCGSGFGFVEKI